ncbi:MAG TPA: amidase family protein [Actinomycetes bacterium]|nr:amidase family protein [Actinomycetes bacterium]
MDLQEYASFDGLGLAELIASGDVSVSEVAQGAVTAAESVNPTLGAIVETYTDRAESVADDLPQGPFRGVPTMVKDLFHGEAGRRCGNGSRLSNDWIVSVDTAFYDRIRRSGLVNLGRTTTSEFGILGTTETLAAGITCSPWSKDHSSGGSSGGAAAVVGSGIVPVASASDGGGSIRIPAASCGVVGLKTSRGRITWGPQIAEALAGWAVHFMVSRSVRDTAALLDALGGPAYGDPFVIPQPARSFLEEVGARVEPLRVAYWSSPWSGQDADPELATATEETARLLESMGHHVEETTPKVEWEPFLRAMTDVWAADNAHTVDSLAAYLGVTPGLDNLEASTLAAVEYGRTVSASQLLDAMGVANTLARTMGWFFSTHDVLLTPTLGRPVAPLRMYDPTEPVELSHMFEVWSAWESFLPIFNATGQPAISLPLHQSEAGLPIGMQLVAAFGQEALLLRLAAQLEEALPWHQRIPPIHASH